MKHRKSSSPMLNFDGGVRMRKFQSCRILALVLALLLLATGCASASKDAAYGVGGMVAETESYSVQSTASAPAAAAPMEEAVAEEVMMDKVENGASGSTAAQKTEAYAKKIIYTAYLRIRADAPQEAAAAAEQACTALGGYVAASYNTTYTNGTAYASATLKVPAEQLETLVDQLSALGTKEELQLTSDDVTRSYYDVQARLTAAKAEEKTLLALLSDCETVEEVLLVREQLSYVRGEIESYQASINLWDHQVAFATVELTVRETEKTAVEGEDNKIELWKASDVARRIANGFDNSWRFLLNAVSAIGIALSYTLLPAAVLAVIVYVLVRLLKLLRRGAKRRKAEKKVLREGKDSTEEKK